jgi:hypothetical protein
LSIYANRKQKNENKKARTYRAFFISMSGMVISYQGALWGGGIGFATGAYAGYGIAKDRG